MSATAAVTDGLARMLSGCTILRPWAEQDEGPYHRDAQPVRRDIVEDRPGTALHPEGVNDEVLGRPPYSARPGRDTTNATDTILPTGGAPAVLDVQAVRGGYRAGVCLLLPSAS
jgi:hypothetical protein